MRRLYNARSHRFPDSGFSPGNQFGCNYLSIGISVGDNEIRPTRDAKRKLRAAEHNLKKLKESGASDKEFSRQEQRVSGYKSHCALTPPKVREQQAWEGDYDREETAKILGKLWKLGKIPKLPDNIAIPENVEGDFIITRDPAYILGMSSFTTGWTSCMAQPIGQYRLGVKLWLAHPACSIAALLSEKTSVYGGIERRNMRARAIVYRFRNDILAYDKFYGDLESIELLKEWLKSQGYVDAKTVAKGEKLVGSADRKYVKKPYFDTLRAVEISLESGRRVWVVKI
jgi:hypothetical protein